MVLAHAIIARPQNSRGQLNHNAIRAARDFFNSLLEHVRHLMKLRRPGVRIENELGRDVSFFQLKDAAASEKSAADLKASTRSRPFVLRGR